MSSISPAAILYATASNAIKYVIDGSDYLLAVASKLRNAAGTVVNPATEDTLATRASETKLETVRVLLASLDGKDYATQTTLATLATDTVLQAVRDRIGEVSATPTANTLQDRLKEIEATLTSLDGKDFSTQTTLASVLTKLTEIDTAIDAIKDTDGIKKITNPVQVSDGTDTLLVESGGQARVLLYDSNARPIVYDDGATPTDPHGILGGSLDPANKFVAHRALYDTADLVYRQQTEARLAPGSQVNIGTGIPANPADLVVRFCMNGASANLRVDGSVTSVVFTFAPTGTDVYAIKELLVVFAADDFEFDGLSFGPNTLLTNGVKIETVINSVTTELFNIKQNEDFLRFPGRPPIVNNTGPKDVLAASFGFGGSVKLHASSSDSINVVVRDNLTSVKYKYFTATVFAEKE